MATEVVKIVDPNGTEGVDCDYNSLADWQADLGGISGGDLVTADVYMVVKCRCTGGTADIYPVIIQNWTTDATRYIQIWTDTSESYRHSGYYQTGNIYRLEVSNTAAMTIKEDFVRVIGLELKSTRSLAGAANTISIESVGTATIAIEKCVFKGVYSGSATGTAILVSDTTATANIRNCIIYDYTGSAGIYCNYGTVNIYNCTIQNCLKGVYRNGATVAAKNVGCADCTTAFDGTITQTTCSSTTPTFANEAADNFHLASGDSTWRGNGTDLSVTFTDDIDGDTRSAWDIGADEYKASVTYGRRVLVVKNA